MNEINFYINTPPQPLKRHRMARGGRVYDPSSTDKKNWMLLAQDFCPREPLPGALEINLEFNMLRPKSHFGTGRNLGKLKDSAPDNHTRTPDLDNLVKFVLDAMNGEFYIDDSQIININCKKLYADKQGESGTFVCIKILEN